MRIDEATRLALEQDKAITLTYHPYIMMIPRMREPYIIVNVDSSRRSNNWNPTGDDILSDQWIVVDRI